jgi:translation initiation factor IF-1
LKNNNNILTTGTIIQRHGGDVYKVKLDNGTELLCWLVSRFRVPNFKGKGKKRPRLQIGDKVKVEIHPLDFSKGMLVGFANRN